MNERKTINQLTLNDYCRFEETVSTGQHNIQHHQVKISMGTNCQTIKHEDAQDIVKFLKEVFNLE